MNHRRIRVRFPGSLGHELVGQLELPKSEPQRLAVFAPCFTCPKEAKAIVRISETLTEAGIGVLRYDVTGSGESHGSFAETSFRSQVDDMAAAADFLEKEHGQVELCVGISLGGATALAAASTISNARAVATINAPSNTQRLARSLEKLAPQTRKEGSGEVVLVGRKTQIGRSLIEDLEQHDVEETARDLHLPLLVCHSTEDTIVPIADGEHLFWVAKQPKSFFAIQDGDHLLLASRELPIQVANIISTWCNSIGF